MSWNPALEPDCPQGSGVDAIETLIISLAAGRRRVYSFVRFINAAMLMAKRGKDFFGHGFRGAIAVDAQVAVAVGGQAFGRKPR